MSNRIIIRENGEYTQDSNTYDLIQKEKDYISYLENHIKNVKLAYEKYFLPLLDKEIACNSELFTREELKKAIISIRDQILKHDNSKWTEYEFSQYRAHWNPTEEEKTRDQYYQNKVDEDYQNAWIHHYKNNDHHPKFWYDFENNVARDMNLGAIIHMLCDWISFNIDSPRGTLEWFINDSVEERKFMSPKTIATVEEILYKWLFPENSDIKEIKPKVSDTLNVYIDNK